VGVLENDQLLVISVLNIALASPPVACSLNHGLEQVEGLVRAALGRRATVVCFPEAYLPGLRGQDFEVWEYGQAEEERVVAEARRIARAAKLMLILGIERVSERGRVIAALVVDGSGEVLGWQTKNQLDPSEDRFYVPGAGRRMFAVEGVPFGIAICHEGWRYPETVRWAAVRGAKVVFHLQHTGYERGGVHLTEWGAATNPYYEQAMRMRARENTIWFASVNYGLACQESATSVIAPDGACAAHLAYDQPGLLVHELDLAAATGLLARRFDPQRHQEECGADGDRP
jgi:predicted amidohydrolase